MNIKELTYLLRHPEQLKKTQGNSLERLIKEFPYFQPIRVLNLKELKNQESFTYNQELKTTAAYTADRAVLFDFITSDLFKKSKENPDTDKKEKTDIQVIDAKEIKTLPRMSMDDAVTMKMEEAEDVLNPALFFTPQEESVFKHITISEELTKQSEQKKKEETTSIQEDEKEEEGSLVEIDKPFDFNKKEKYSFSEWLKLTSLKPIDRSKEDQSDISETSSTQKENETNSLNQEKQSSQKQKFDLVDQFIANNPKIPRPSKSITSSNLAKKNQTPPEELMTETLARVYLAQKNYKKAIQAYKILILKNPEKSGFFADQIQAIKKLKENK